MHAYIQVMFARTFTPWDILTIYEATLSKDDRLAYLVDFCCALAGISCYRRTVMHAEDKQEMMLLFEMMPALRCFFFVYVYMHVCVCVCSMYANIVTRAEDKQEMTLLFGMMPALRCVCVCVCVCV